MAFEEVRPERLRNQTFDNSQVSVAFYSSSEICVYIPQPLLDRLGWLQESYVAFHEGIGNDAGFFAITPGGICKLRPRSMKTLDGCYIRLSPGNIKNYIVDPGDNVRIDFQAMSTQCLDGRIVAMMPSWMKSRNN